MVCVWREGKVSFFVGWMIKVNYLICLTRAHSSILVIFVSLELLCDVNAVDDIKD